MTHGARAADTPAPGAAGGPHELPVFILTGPTGAGKTDWALGLAESAPVEIVSVDSALVYRGLDIGTAKPARELRARVPHHLIDLCEPTESYSAGRPAAALAAGRAGREAWMAGAARGAGRPGPGSGRAHRAGGPPTDPACARSLLHDRTADLTAAACDHQSARRLATALLGACPQEASHAARAYRPAL